MTNVTSLSRADRVAAAARLTAMKESSPTGNAGDAEMLAIQAALKAEKMPLPFEDGKQISAVYFSEVFLRYNMTIADWLAANYTKNSDVQKQIDEAVAAATSGNKLAPVIKK